jgi:hypothetical protein
MATPDLTGALAKIERAKEHIRDLDREKTAFLALNPYTVTPEYYVEHGATAYFLDECREIPICVPLLTGDAAHCLRTALDYLAYSLVPTVVGQEPATHIYFPICKGLKEYRTESVRKTDGIPQSTKDRIDAFKPYLGGDDRLWKLHQLDIVDKHRLLTTAATVVTKMGFAMDADWVEESFKGFIKFSPGSFPKQVVYLPAPKPLFPMEKGALLYAVAGDHETNKRINLTFDIAFGESEIFAGNLLIETLSELTDLVQSIVFSFI